MSKPRKLHFETWRGEDRQHYCHLRSGAEILLSSEGYARRRSCKRIYEIVTSANVFDATYEELKTPYKPKKKGSRKPKHFEGHLNRPWP